MRRFNFGPAKAPHCPLCGKLMERYWESQRQIFVWRCYVPGNPMSCKIAIRVDDPFIGRWEEAYDNATDKKGIECPREACQRKMRYFATSTGFMKARCPKCGASVANGGIPGEGTIEDTTPEKPGRVQ